MPAAVVLAAWVVWIGASGGYSPDVWYPSALGALSLWAAVVIGGRRVLPEAKVARIAILAFLALVALNYLSILWAGSPGNALDASNQLVLYMLVAWTLAVLPWTPRGLATLLGIWSLCICAFCAVALLRATSASSLTLFFTDSRFSTPMQYSNATGALGVMGMWPSLILASRRELRFWLRGAGLGIATFLAGFATLPQSRAALLGLVLTVPVALAVASDRIRLLIRMLIVGGALAICVPRTIEVDDAVSTGRRVAPALSHAAQAMMFTSLAALLVGALLALLEDRLSGSLWRRRNSKVDRPGQDAGSSATRKQGRVVLAGSVVAIVVLAAAASVSAPKVGHLVQTVVKNGNTDAGTGSTRLISTSPEERFDYARVALHLFSGSPILGIGDGNFGRRYDGLRKFVKHSQYTHNLPLRVLSETGIVGALVFLVLMAALVVGMIQVAHRRAGLGRACVAVAFSVSGYFLLHSCLDWMDEFPALAGPAIGLPLASMGLLGAAPTMTAGSASGRRQASSRRVAITRLIRGLGVLGWVAAFVALTVGYLSTQYVNRAFAIFRSRPQQAYHDLHVAGSLNPLSVNPLTSEGTIALYLGNYRRSVAAFQRSVLKEDGWYPRMELALLEGRLGRFGLARRQLDAAARLNHDDPLIAEASALLERHRRVDPISFNQKIEQQGLSAATQQPIR